jgi:hypothetical protein
MNRNEKLFAIAIGGVFGLVALIIGGLYLAKFGSKIEVTSDQLVYGFFHAVILGGMAIFGWFSALRVGPAIPTPLKVAVLAATAVLYYWATKLWIPLIIKFFAETLPMAGAGGATMSKGPMVFTVLLAAFIIIAFLIPFTKGAFKR